MNLALGYESSDDEENAPVVKPEKPTVNDATHTVAKTPNQEPVPSPAPIAQPSAEQGDLNGPAIGPTDHPTQPRAPKSAPSPSPPSQTSTSPPPPPGSPPHRSTTKFTQFLSLKQKGQHFNQRLETSSVLRDPAHLQRLMDFAGISAEEQYASSLPPDLGIPTTFPKWGYAEELRESQKRISKVREEANARNPREVIDFVPASVSVAESGTGTPAGKLGRQSKVERVMAGLDRAAPLQTGKRKELEQRGGRNEKSGRKWDSRSRSPKRRRSRSRERR